MVDQHEGAARARPFRDDARDDAPDDAFGGGRAGRDGGGLDAPDLVQDATSIAGRDYPFTIGDLAREFGATLRTLRFYEEKGLLKPRREGQSRRYSRRDRARLSLILLGKRLGFSLHEISDVLALYDLPDGQRRQLEVTRERLSHQLTVLEEQKANLETATWELRALAREIDRRLSR